MTTKISRKATLALGALLAYLAPKIAQDAKGIDLVPALEGVDAKTFDGKKAAIIDGVKKAVEGKLATDASMEDLASLIDAVGGAGKGENGEDAYDDEKGGGSAAVCEFLKTKLSPEDYAQVEKLLGGTPAATAAPALKPAGAQDDQDDGTDSVPKAAMDAAVAEATEKATKAATDAARKEHKAIRDAERAVRPYVGEIAMDSVVAAADVYRAAFKVLGVDVKDVHESAFPALLKAQKPAGGTPRVAEDAAPAKSYHERFPESARLA